MSHPACVYPLCKKCDNNAGGVCAYDHEAEAAQFRAYANTIILKNKLDRPSLVDETGCLLYDPIEIEAEN